MWRVGGNAGGQISNTASGSVPRETGVGSDSAQQSQSSSVGTNQSIDKAQGQKAAEHLNQMLAGSTTKVELDSNSPVNDIWLNIVDKTTGQVIERLPPEGVRQFLQTGSTKGLSKDLSL